MIELKSYAKINLGLEIAGKRADGYHNLKTIFQTIDFYDTLQVSENHERRLVFKSNDNDLTRDDRNTVIRAFKLIYENFNVNQGFDVFLNKNIPSGSGLGGGSSNAAVVLMFLNHYFGLEIRQAELISLGKSIGADVPFFFLGGTVLAQGIGEVMTEIPEPETRDILLVIPEIRVSTGLIFSHVGLTSRRFNSKIDVFLNSKNTNVLENDLEPITFQKFPEIKRIKEKMQAFESNRVMMSGSGSALFCVIGDGDWEDLRKVFPAAIFTRTINKHDYQNHIGAWPSGKASVFGADIRRFESSRPRSKT
jgi:4-diphosphocytidyl-2-C-methyl-D-erythritol kinase